MKHKQLIMLAGALMALPFAPSLFAANVWFGTGTHSASEYTASFSTANVLASNNIGRWLVFDDTNTYTIGSINLRNTVFTGTDSAIFIDSGTLNVAGRTDIGGNANTRGTLAVRESGTLNTVTLSVGNSAGTIGIFTQSGGVTSVSAALFTARGAGASASLDISGGTMTIAGVMTLNQGGVAPTETLSGDISTAITVSGTGKLYGLSSWSLNETSGNANGASNVTMVVKDGGYVNNNLANVYTMVGRAANAAATISVQNGGIATFKKLTLGDAYQSTGVVEVSGNGKLTTTYISMANRSSSTGILRISDTGSLDLGTDGAINVAAASTSTNANALIEISGGTLSGGSIVGITGANSSASININGGLLTLSGNAGLGAASGATMTLSLTSGTFAANNLNVAGADGASGTVSVTGGTMAIANTLNLALITANATQGKKAVYSQTGGTVTAGEVYVGANNIDTASNSAVVTISGGSLTSNTFFNIGASGANGTASAQATVTDTGALTATTISVMRAGTLSSNGLRLGTGAQAAATGEAAAYRIIIANGAVNTGIVTNASGMLSMRSGTLSATELQVGTDDGATATVNVTGGVTTIANSMTLGLKTNNAATSGVYSQGAGTVWVKQVTMGNAANDTQTVSGIIDLTGGTLQIGNFLTMGSTVSGVVSVANATVAAGATLNAGRINVNGGAILDIAGNLAMTTPVSGSNNVTLNASANEGDAVLIIRDGATVSTLGNIALNQNAKLTLGVGNAFNTVSVGGALAFSTVEGVLGTQVLTLDFTGVSDPSGDHILFSCGSEITGFNEWVAFATTNLVIEGLADGYTFDGLSLGADNKSLIATITIPEPAAAAALLGLLGLALVVRRRR